MSDEELPGFAGLSRDLLGLIFSYLPTKERHRSAQVNKWWKLAAHEYDNAHKREFATRFPEFYKRISERGRRLIKDWHEELYWARKYANYFPYEFNYGNNEAAFDSYGITRDEYAVKYELGENLEQKFSKMLKREKSDIFGHGYSNEKNDFFLAIAENDAEKLREIIKEKKKNPEFDFEEFFESYSEGWLGMQLSPERTHISGEIRTQLWELVIEKEENRNALQNWWNEGLDPEAEQVWWHPGLGCYEEGFFCSSGWNLMKWALCIYHSEDYVKDLLRHKKNPGLLQSVFILAAEYQRHKILEFLIDNNKVGPFHGSMGDYYMAFDYGDEDGYTALQRACEFDHRETAKLLITRQPNLLSANYSIFSDTTLIWFHEEILGNRALTIEGCRDWLAYQWRMVKNYEKLIVPLCENLPDLLLLCAIISLQPLEEIERVISSGAAIAGSDKYRVKPLELSHRFYPAAETLMNNLKNLTDRNDSNSGVENAGYDNPDDHKRPRSFGGPG